MKQAFAIAVVASLATLSLSGAASAAVVVGPDVNGYGTFTDTNTGRNWLRLDSFYAMSANSLQAAATAAGFTIAEKRDVEILVGSLPLDGMQFADYKAIMGGAPNREIIWGVYLPITGVNFIRWAFARDTGGWLFDENTSVTPDFIVNPGTNIQDMNIWAYVEPSVGGVPEPTTWVMFIAGFGLVGAVARRRMVRGSAPGAG